MRDLVLEFREWIVAETRGGALLRTGWAGGLFSMLRLRLGFWSLGRPLAILLTRVFGAFIARQRTEHENDAFTDQLRLGIGMTVGSDLFDKLLHLLKPELLVCHLPPSETERHFDLNFLAKEIDGVAELDPKVMWIN